MENLDWKKPSELTLDEVKKLLAEKEIQEQKNLLEEKFSEVASKLKEAEKLVKEAVEELSQKDYYMLNSSNDLRNMLEEISAHAYNGERLWDSSSC
jgi:DNA-binding transcriptional MerR regulator